MEIESRTIILSTPEELFPLITQAVRTAEQGKTADAPDLPGKKLLAPKDVKREVGIHQKTRAYWRMEGVGPAIQTLAGGFFMNAPYWKSILYPAVSKPRNQSDDGRLRPAYPL